jgi:hypothetical protein
MSAKEMSDKRPLCEAVQYRAWPEKWGDIQISGDSCPPALVTVMVSVRVGGVIVGGWILRDNGTTYDIYPPQRFAATTINMKPTLMAMGASILFEDERLLQKCIRAIHEGYDAYTRQQLMKEAKNA